MKRTHKLRNQRGFSLAETLLAVLILLLVSTIVATGMPVAVNVYEKTVLSANAQSLLSTTVSALRDELGTAWNVEVEGNTGTYYSADTGNRSELKMDGGTITLTEFLSIDLLKPTVNAEEGEGERGSSNSIERMRTLIPNATLTRDLDISYQSVTYSNGVVVFTNLQVTPKGKSGSVVAKMNSLRIKVVSWQPTVSPE